MDASVSLDAKELPSPLDSDEDEGVALAHGEVGVLHNVLVSMSRAGTTEELSCYSDRGHHDLHFLVALHGDPWRNECDAGN